MLILPSSFISSPFFILFLFLFLSTPYIWHIYSPFFPSFHHSILVIVFIVFYISHSNHSGHSGYSGHSIFRDDGKMERWKLLHAHST
jgi:hypothetical protein